MTAVPPRPDNWELRKELEKLPDNVTGEVIGGTLYTMGRHLDENPITVVPDWICEILSSSTRPPRHRGATRHATTRAGDSLPEGGRPRGDRTGTLGRSAGAGVGLSPFPILK